MTDKRSMRDIQGDPLDRGALSISSASGEDRNAKTNAGIEESALIESVWIKLNGQFRREEIRRSVQEVSDRFSDATVKNFIPILIQRAAVSHLQNTDKQHSS